MTESSALRALSSPARQEIIRLVWEAERPSTAIAESVGLTRPATSQHLKVLRDAGLVDQRVDGNQRLYRANQERLAELRSFIDGFWAESLDRLDDALGDMG